MKLDLIALTNLSVLSEHDNKTHFLQIDDKINITSNEREKEYENVTELNDIEYSIHFTFHHTFTLINNTSLQKSKKHIIMSMASAPETIYDIYINQLHEDHNKIITEMLEHIDMVIDIIHDNYHKYYCYYKFTNYCNNLLSEFKKSMIIMNEINKELYIGFDSCSDSDSDSDSEYESDKDK